MASLDSFKNYVSWFSVLFCFELCVYVCSCVCVHPHECQCLETREGYQIPRAGVPGGCQPLDVGAGNPTGLPEESCALLTTQPSLQPPVSDFKGNNCEFAVLRDIVSE